MKITKSLLPAFVLMLFFHNTNAEITVPSIFSDHMVLQQEAEVTIWGWADANEIVKVHPSWSTIPTELKANHLGEWKLKISTPKSGKTHELTISGADNVIKISDILLGEVWVCGGQSNMVWPMGNLGTERGKKDISEADYPEIRLFTVGHQFVTTATPFIEGKWKVCTPETAAKFSATGFYFGKNLYEGLQQPVGLISTNSGGTPAKAWMSKEALEAFGGFEEELSYVENYEERKEEIAQESIKLYEQWIKNIESLDSGLPSGYQKVDYNDADWDDMTLSSTWKNTPLEEVDGIVWFRSDFELGKKQSKKDLILHLGAIDDMDKVWVNGFEVGSTDGWDVQRRYELPAGILKNGKNVIAVRVIDAAGDGGFKGKPSKLRLSTKRDTESTVVILSPTWGYQIAYQGKLPPRGKSDKSLDKRQASVLFNGMIHPIVQYNVKGVVWYQGEADQQRPEQYRKLFPALIKDWRNQWDNEAMPFYFVQIAPYQYNKEGSLSYALREAQLQTLSLANTGIAITMDIGKGKNIHPKTKHHVGDRLARVALAKTYQKNIPYSGPMYSSTKVENSIIRVYFDHAENGLMITEPIEGNFKVAGENGVFENANVKVEGSTLVLSSKKVPQPKYVRYGWSNWVQGNLFNQEGLPASSFRTDQLPLGQNWIINTQADWKGNEQSKSNLEYVEGEAVPTSKYATYKSKLKQFESKKQAKSILVDQSAVWHNWQPVPNIGPSNLQDAPVALRVGDTYWMFGKYGTPKNQKLEDFERLEVQLEGYDQKLHTSPFAEQYDAEGGLNPSLGGYHAWESKDMKTWIHHGPVSEKFSRWMTTAEYVDGQFYLYYDFPNDQDPHLYIDDDLKDGLPGKNMGMVFKDPTHGSDCAVIRDLKGNFHIITEDWSPIKASTRSWDSPLAVHAVSPDGVNDFEILDPPVDNRTKPTGKTGTYKHPHWHKEDPENYKTNVAEYNIHEPEQEAYGDWAAVSIGGQYYLFGDYDPIGGEHMSVCWFTSSDINKPFKFSGHIGNGHPDPDIIFTKGTFHLVTQQDTDYVSPGPWVENVDLRIGVDTDNDGIADYWTGWKTVRESYTPIEGFSKQLDKQAAMLDLSELPKGFGFQFEVKISDQTQNESKPILDQIIFSFVE
ncbi:MAG: sialate O-acetylesterase [Cyclobacteriaceae bacterium]